MPTDRAKVLVSVPILLGSIAAMAFATAEWPAAGPGPVDREVGHALARETLRLLGAGGHVVLVARDPAAFRAPADALVLDVVERDLRKAGVEVSQRQFYAVDPLRPPQIPPGDAFEFLRRGAAGDVVLSLIGPPLLGEDQRATLGPVKAKVVAFCPGNMGEYVNLPLLAESGLLHGGVFSKPAGIASGPPATETFESLYAVGLPAAAKP